jgi:hypothetical protein
MVELLAFLYAAFTSLEGCVVGASFALLIWTMVGVQALANRRRERRDLAELNAALAAMPRHDRADKRLVHDYPLENRHAAA